MMKISQCSQKLMALWYGSVSGVAYGLWPLSWFYRLIVTVRRVFYRCRIFRVTHFPSQIIVVGNLTVGGTGKTPLVLLLAKQLQAAGKRVGIVSRGYRGCDNHRPHWVTERSTVAQIGDEAVLLRRAGCPMVVCRDRVAAVKKLLQKTHCDVILSDDGLQHYALGRDIEIVVVDGKRVWGNRHCLPLGPLREPLSRLNTVNAVVVNGDSEVAINGSAALHRMQLVPTYAYSLQEPDTRLSLESLQGKAFHAVAGIGHPERFFQTLESLGVQVTPLAFPDHHEFSDDDFKTLPEEVDIIMTEKDAVKCRSLSFKQRCWVLVVEAELGTSDFFSSL